MSLQLPDLFPGLCYHAEVTFEGAFRMRYSILITAFAVGFCAYADEAAE